MKKFVLVAQQGSFTRALTRLLNSHPQIDLAEEFLNSKPERIYDDAIAEIKKKGSFNVKYNHLFYYDHDLASWLAENDYACLHIIRDPARCFIRHIAKYGGGFGSGDVREFVNKVNKWREDTNKLFDDVLEVHYEDMTRGQKIKTLPQDVEYRIEDWLGVRHRHLEADISNYRVLEHLPK